MVTALPVGSVGGMATVGSCRGSPLKVVATFSILGDMVKAVGGERIQLTTLVGADSDGHVYQPTPADAKTVAQADILFVNGLGFEGWLERLVEASGYKGKVVTVTEGITGLPLAEGVIIMRVDPHAWQNLANAKRTSRILPVPCRMLIR